MANIGTGETLHLTCTDNSGSSVPPTSVTWWISPVS
jgi:hypothetical protein